MNTTRFMNQIMGNVFKTQTSPALPLNFYLGLSTTLPTLAGGNVTEPSTAGGYSRIQISNLSTPSGGAIHNTSALTFNTAASSWGSIPYYCIWDAGSGGNLLMWGTLATPKTVSTGDILMFAEGDLVITLENKS